MAVAPEFRLLNLPPRLTHAIVRKMEGNRFFPMYKTCSQMSEVAEQCLSSIHSKDMKIAKLHKLNAKKHNVRIEYDGKKRNHYGNIIMTSQILGLNVLNSSFWRFITVKHVYLEDDDTATKYLEKLRGRELDSFGLRVNNCSISTVVDAFKIFRPILAKITPFTSDHYEILSVLPFRKWKEHGLGKVDFGYSPQGYKDVSKHLGNVEVLNRKIEDLNGSHWEFIKLKTPCGTTLTIHVHDGGIRYCIFEDFDI